MKENFSTVKERGADRRVTEEKTPLLLVELRGGEIVQEQIR